MTTIKTLLKDPDVRTAVSAISDDPKKTIDLAIQIQQIPAPTFAEKERAEFVRQQFEELGLSDVSMDEMFNVYGCLPAIGNENPLIVSAHSDTVFDKETDLTVREENGRLYGPGIGDNSLGVAGLIRLAQVMVETGIKTKVPIWFVCNTREEGLGDLQGMRKVVERFGDTAQYIVLEGGFFGQITCQGIGVQRYKVEVTAEGGHSWGDFGRTSAVHEIGRLISQISDLHIPRFPKSSLNIGVVEGGTTINTIAANASFLLDIRSVDTFTLSEISKAVRLLINEFDAKTDATIQVTEIGNRPSGKISQDDALVQAALKAAEHVGKRPTFVLASTDANIPLARGLSAVCIGITRGGNAHRLDEYIETSFVGVGMKQLLLTMLQIAICSIPKSHQN